MHRIWRETIGTLVVLLAVTFLVGVVERVEAGTVDDARVHLTGPDVRIQGMNGLDHDLTVLRNSMRRSLFGWLPALSVLAGAAVGAWSRTSGAVWVLGAVAALPPAATAAAFVIDLPLPAVLAGGANLVLGAALAGGVGFLARRRRCSTTSS